MGRRDYSEYTPQKKQVALKVLMERLQRNIETERWSVASDYASDLVDLTKILHEDKVIAKLKAELGV